MRTYFKQTKYHRTSKWVWHYYDWIVVEKAVFANNVYCSCDECYPEHLQRKDISQRSRAYNRNIDWANYQYDAKVVGYRKLRSFQPYKTQRMWQLGFEVGLDGGML